MPKTTLPDTLALRIGLAARTLPETELARFVTGLDRVLGRPLTEERLDRLTLDELRRAATDPADPAPDEAALRTALAILRGEQTIEIEPPPPVEPYVEGDLPASIRVACASNHGEELDGHFGSASRFLIYQVAPRAQRLIAVRETRDRPPGEDKTAALISLIEDCTLLYVASIGGPAAAKAVRAGLHPIKDAAGGSARERMARLGQILADQPPPWLAKAMSRASVGSASAVPSEIPDLEDFEFAHPTRRADRGDIAFAFTNESPRDR